jgi:hypothetical protein
MFLMEIKVDIVDYMGKIDDGVLVLLSVNCDGYFTEGTIFYSNEDIVFTVDSEVEKKVGGPIEYWEGYLPLIESVLKKLVPLDEIYNRLDYLNMDDYVSVPEDGHFIDEEIDLEKINFGTQSNA